MLGFLFRESAASWKLAVATYGFSGPLLTAFTKDQSRDEAVENITEHLEHIAMGYAASVLIEDFAPNTSKDIPAALVMMGMTSTAFNAAMAPFSSRTERAGMKISTAMERHRS